MAEVVHPGENIRNWTGSRSEDGFPEYNVTWTVQATGKEGPAAVMAATGLPAVGSAYNFFTDADAWAFCTPYLKVKSLTPGEAKPGAKVLWEVQQKFKTLQETEVTVFTGDPLLEPPKISGSFVNRSYFYKQDHIGASIHNVAFEIVEVEGDKGYPTVRITINKPTLPLQTYSQAHNRVNDGNMWGLGLRQVKLDNISWERMPYVNNTFYFPTTFEFDINEETFDRDDIPQEGEKVLDGQWDEISGAWVNTAGANASDPADFIRMIDLNGNPMRGLLNESGNPLLNSTTLYLDTVKLYKEFNFFTLGIPSNLETGV